MTSPAKERLHIDTMDARLPGGAPVLCLHGMFAGSWAFEGLMPMIAARGTLKSLFERNVKQSSDKKKR